jgi:hypothetical protein
MIIERRMDLAEGARTCLGTKGSRRYLMPATAYRCETPRNQSGSVGPGRGLVDDRLRVRSNTGIEDLQS